MAENITIRFRVRGQKAAKRAFKSLEENAENLRRTGRKMRDVGRSLTVGLTLPLTLAGGAATKLAADAQEAANKFEVVMGDAADEVREKFRGLTDTIPLTISRMEELSAGIQDLLVPMGVARGQAANMSAEFVKLAADLASFNNVPTDVALEAIKSALAGMSRPIRQFGVDVRKTRIQQLALTEGFIEQGEEMNRTARAMAVMRAIVLDSEDAIGDAARTANEFTNQMRFLRRDARQLGEDIGELLIPVVRPLIGHFRDMAQTFGTLSPAMQKTVLVAGGLAAALGPVLAIMGQMAIAISALVTGPAGIVALTAAIIGGGGLVFAYNQLKGTQTKVTEASKDLREETDRLKESMDEMGESAVQSLRQSAAMELADVTREIRELQDAMPDQSGGPRGGAFFLNINEMLGIGPGVSEETEQRIAELRGLQEELQRRLRELASGLGDGGGGDGGGGVAGAANQAADAMASIWEGAIDAQQIFQDQLERTRRALVDVVRVENQLATPAGGGIPTSERVSNFLGRTSPAGVTGTGGGGGVGLPFGGMVDASEEAGRSMDELIDVTLHGSDGLRDAAQVAVSSFGAMAEAAVRGSEQMEVSIINGITNILRSIPGVGQFAGAVIGAGGGLLSAIIGGGSDKGPQPVTVENKDPIEVEDQSDSGPETVILQTIDSADPAQLEHDLNRRTRRDGVTRLPFGDLEGRG